MKKLIKKILLKKKIENGYGLSNNRDITKELITANFKSDELEYKWECSEYERKVYGKNYSVFGLNSRKELLKEKIMADTSVEIYD